jgi:hypothetical protein
MCPVAGGYPVGARERIGVQIIANPSGSASCGETHTDYNRCRRCPPRIRRGG